MPIEIQRENAKVYIFFKGAPLTGPNLQFFEMKLVTVA
jgi:hypothetical protein